MQAADFRSVAGESFPLMSVFAGLVGYTHVRPCVSSDPARIDALLIDTDELLRLMVANFTPDSISVEVAAASESSPRFTIEAAPYSVTTSDNKRRAPA